MILKKRYTTKEAMELEHIQLQKFEWEVYLLLRFNHRLESIQEKLGLSTEDLSVVIRTLEEKELIKEITFSFNSFMEKFYPNIDLKIEKTNQITFADIKSFIHEKIGQGKNAEMALFRILLAIPPKLLQSSGIQSIKNIDDDMPITNQLLLSKINQSIQKVVGVPLLTA